MVVTVLAGLEDLAVGVGQVQQERRGQLIAVSKVDLPCSVHEYEDLANIDVTKYSKGKVGCLFYEYSDTNSAGLKSNVGRGHWVPLLPKMHDMLALPEAAENKNAFCIYKGKPVFSSGTAWLYFDNTEVN